jgi:elongation factor P
LKVSTSDVKKGMILEHEGQLVRVIDFSFMQMQQRAATYTYKLKNIVTGAVTSLTVKSTVMLDKAEVNTNNAVYLYNSGDVYSFMENDSGEIFDLNKDSIDDVIPYLKENLDVLLMIYQGNVL